MVRPLARRGVRGAFPTHVWPDGQGDSMQAIRNFWADESGQGLAEYALLLGLIVVGVVVIIKGMGGHIKNIFTKANTNLASADS